MIWSCPTCSSNKSVDEGEVPRASTSLVESDKWGEVPCASPSSVEISTGDILIRSNDYSNPYHSNEGNQCLLQLTEERRDEYCALSEKNSIVIVIKSYIITQMFKQLHNENRKFLREIDGVWKQMDERDIRRKIMRNLQHPNNQVPREKIPSMITLEMIINNGVARMNQNCTTGTLKLGGRLI
jgi:hypothetical protein